MRRRTRFPFFRAGAGAAAVACVVAMGVLSGRAGDMRDKYEYRKDTRGPNRLTLREQHFQETSKKDIAQLIEDVKSKSFRQKIEDAYDASIKAHEIGFPSSVSRSRKREKE